MAHDEPATGRPIPHSANRQCVLCKPFMQCVLLLRRTPAALTASWITRAIHPYRRVWRLIQCTGDRHGLDPHLRRIRPLRVLARGHTAAPDRGGQTWCAEALTWPPSCRRLSLACAATTLRPDRGGDILVSMTRKSSTLAAPTAQPLLGRWRLQDAKARFSELVRMAHSNGPQHVTLHGRDAVVVVDADEFNRLKGARTGELLIAALQASPHRQSEIEPSRSAMSVRSVKL